MVVQDGALRVRGERPQQDHVLARHALLGWQGSESSAVNTASYIERTTSSWSASASSAATTLPSASGLP